MFTPRLAHIGASEIAGRRDVGHAGRDDEATEPPPLAQGVRRNAHTSCC